MPSRRERRKMRRKGKSPKGDSSPEEEEDEAPKEEKKEERNALKRFYEDQYKFLLAIPFIILLLAMGVIGYQVATTGDFVDKDVSLKGGLTINVLTGQDIDTDKLEEDLHSEFPQGDLRVRALTELGEQVGVIIDASDVDQDVLMDYLSDKIDNFEDNHSAESIGPALGQSFFEQTARAVWIAFIFMGMVVFLYFGESGKMKFLVSAISVVTGFTVWFSSTIITLIISLLLCASLIYLYIKYSMPSAAVILAAMSDIIVTIAVMNLLDIRLSTAGIAALLMLIGYSVDTDILLSTRLLKRKQGTLMERMYSAIKTGLTMNVTTLAAITVALIVSQSETITQIMTILLIGLIIDIINTWLQNTGILRWYMERRTE